MDEPPDLSPAPASAEHSTDAHAVLARVRGLYPDADFRDDGWILVGGEVGAFLRLVEDRAELAFPDCSGDDGPVRNGKARPGAVWRTMRLARLQDDAAVGAFLGRAFAARQRQFVHCEWCGRLLPGECSSGRRGDEDFCPPCNRPMPTDYKDRDGGVDVSDQE